MHKENEGAIREQMRQRELQKNSAYIPFKSPKKSAKLKVAISLLISLLIIYFAYQYFF